MNIVAAPSAVAHDAAIHEPTQPLSTEARAIRRILICVDDSAVSEACLRQGVAISMSLGSSITLLHVMQPRDRSGAEAPDVVDWEINRQQATAYLDRLANEGTSSSGRKVDVRLEQGRPVDRITAVAREIDADLTVLGGRGGGTATWNLGSTVLQVLAMTRGSVLIARANPSVAGAASPKRILVPLDGSLRAESVLPTSVRIAKERATELLLVFVVREPVASAVLHTPEDIAVARDLAARLAGSGRDYLDGLRAQLVREGASVRALVLRTADEKQALMDLARDEAVALIVLSAHGSTCNPELSFGGLSAHLLIHALVPVLVLQDLGDSELRGREQSQNAPPHRSGFPQSD